MSQIKKGALLSYVNILLTNVIGLVLTPFIIKSLGNSEYGLYTLIGSIIAYFTLIDFGLGDTVIRYVAKYRAQKNKEEESNFLGIALRLYLLITGVLLVLGSFVYFNLETIFKKSLTVSELYDAHVLFALLLFNLAISLPGNLFLGITNAYERFTYAKGIMIVKYIVRSFIILIVLLLEGKAIAIVLVDTMINVLFISCNIYYVLNKIDVKIVFNKFKIIEVKNILSFSIWMFFLGVISQFQWQGGQVMLGVLANTKTVAIYSVGILLGGYYGAFSSAITSLFLPRATQMVVNNASPEDLMDVMIRVGRISLFLLFLILGGFILLGKEFVLLWVGKDYLESWTIALIIMLVYTIPLVQTFANSLMEANKKVYYKAIIYGFTIGLGTVLGYFFFKKFGMVGIISSVSFFWLLGIGLLNMFYVKELNLNMFLFFRVVFFKAIICLMFILPFSCLVLYLPINGWFGFLIKGCIYGVIYFLIMFSFYLNAEEKNHFLMFRKKFF